MYVFLDESGIHLKTGHSVFGVVYVESKDLPAINSAMSALESSLKLASLHWKDMAWVVRAKVFAGLKPLPFQFEVAVINNPVRNDSTIVTQILGELLGMREHETSTIYIDGRKSRNYEALLKKSLRDVGVKTGKLKTVNDRAFPGIQIADLVAGVYRHQIDKPSAESAKLQRMIASKQK